MIKVEIDKNEKSAVQIKGSGAELLNDLSNMVYGVVTAMMKGYDDKLMKEVVLEMATDAIQQAIDKVCEEQGLADDEDDEEETSDLEKEIEEIEKKLPKEAVEAAKVLAKVMAEAIKGKNNDDNE